MPQSVTASISSYNVGASSVALALPIVPSQTAVLVTNNSVHNVYVALGITSAVVATTASTLVPPGRTKYFAVSTNLYIAAISPAGANIDVWTAL